MNIVVSPFRCRKIVDRVVLFISQLVAVTPGAISKKMDNSISEEVKQLLQRLTEAEERAKLLKCEIKDIRTQIAGLTESANRILSYKGASRIFSRNSHLLHSSNVASSTTSKRPLDESDFSDLIEPKRARDDIPMENGYVVVYTDGACENNGKSNAKAGIGVWFSDGNPINVSKPVVGRATNNTAEIQAPTEALKVLQTLGYKKVKIITDSQFTINCMTKWIQKWKKNQWKLTGGGPVKNKEDLVKLDSLSQQFIDVKWEYCAGHKGIKGNEEADKLARDGALRYTP